jgi:hypothetical protein
VSRANGIPPIPFDVDGFVGCRDQRSQKYRPGEMESIVNMMPESNERPSKLSMRQGYERFTTFGGSVAGAITNSGDHQLAIDVTFTGNSNATALLINGAGVWSLDFAAGVVTQELTAAQITAAGAPSQASFAGAVSYNGFLIVANSAGKLWKWNGTTGGGITVLANSPAGGALSITVYGGKIMIVSIVSGGTNELVWSEEGDETIGYKTAPYSNFWPLRQQGQETLQAICGTNDGLVYFRRERGCGVIFGDVDSAFRTSSTKDGLSIDVGVSRNPQIENAPREGANGCVMFFDKTERPMLYRPGRGLVNLWEQLPRSTGRWDGAPWGLGEVSAYSTARCAYYDSTLNCHVFTYYSGSRALLFDASTDKFVTTWAVSSGGAVDSTLLWVHSVPIRVSAGSIFWQKDNDDFGTRSWSDETASGAGNAVTGIVIGPPHGSNLTLNYWFDRVDVVVGARAAYTVTLGFVTSEAHKGSLTPADQSTSPAGLTNIPFQKREEFGLPELAPARWLMPYIALQPVAGAIANQLSLYGYHVEARPDTQGVGTN